jgi:malonyl CoA-acyl carrier protein transacylase/4'-phosphopantetheinyl transferase EntD/acyl carrier protein
MNTGVARLAVVGSTVAEWGERLAAAARLLAEPARTRINDTARGIYYQDLPLGREGRLALLFPGEGAQYPNMLADLCLQYPEMVGCFDLLDRALDDGQSPPPSQFIFSPPAPADAAGDDGAQWMWRMDAGVEVVFTANRAMLHVLQGLGVRPDVIMGHSTGEYNALLAAGAIRVRDDTELLRHLRDGNRLSAKLLAEDRVQRGALLAVGPADPQVIARITQPARAAVSADGDTADARVWLALDNCPHQVVLFGTEVAIDVLAAELRGAGAVCQRLPFDRAYHTPLFAPVRDELAKLFADVLFEPPQTQVYCGATAQPYPPDPHEIRRLLLEQWTSPVRFREAIENMYAAGVRIFVEAGPRGNLTAFVDDTLRGRPHAAIASDVISRPSHWQLRHVAARLIAQGVGVRLDFLGGLRAPRPQSVPSARGNGEHRPMPDRGPMPLRLSLPFIELPDRAPAVPSERRQASADDSRPRGTPQATPAVSAPQGRADEAMKAYLGTMARFLETQQAVMQRFLAPRADSPKSNAPVPHNAAQRPPESKALADTPTHPNPQPRQTIEDVLLRIMSERTGYPRDMLDLSAGLEADLGIDSIKRIEILGAFQQETGLPIAEQMESVSRLKTLREILDFASNLGGGETPESEGTAHAAPPDTSPPIAKGSLVGDVISLTPGREARIARTFDLREDVLLLDHALGAAVSDADADLHALVVLPLTLSIECLAQTAALLAPGCRVAQVRNVRARRWLPFIDPTLEVRVTATVDGTPGTTEVRASLTEHPAPAGEIAPAVEATIVFLDAVADHTRALPAGHFDLLDDGPAKWVADELYSKVMFHGPAFRGVRSLDRVGRDGLEATLAAPPDADLSGRAGGPRFLTEPLLLDALGQLVGFWTASTLDRGYVVFPFHVDRIDLHRPPVPGESFKSRARVALRDGGLTAADLDIVSPDGKLIAQAQGWQDKRIDMPQWLFQMRLAPRDVSVGEPWRDVLPAGESGLTCIRLDADEKWFEQDRGVWAWVLAWLALGRREREAWRALQGPPRRRIQWLLGRVAAKDAVRAFGTITVDGHAQRSRRQRLPADIQIQSDDAGRPYVRLLTSAADGDADAPPPLLSIAHTHGTAVALAADPALYDGVGVDVEPISETRAGLSDVILSPDERSALAAAGVELDHEWVLRVWCAKESAGKALGVGLPGGPADFRVCGAQPQTGEIHLIAAGALADAVPEALARRFTAVTSRAGGLIVSVCCLRIGAQASHHDGSRRLTGARMLQEKV